MYQNFLNNQRATIEKKCKEFFGCN